MQRRTLDGPSPCYGMEEHNGWANTALQCLQANLINKHTSLVVVVCLVLLAFGVPVRPCSSSSS